MKNATTAASAPIQTWLVFLLSSESIIITVFLPTPAFLPDWVSELGTRVTALVTARFPWQDGEPLPTLYKAVGCPACAKTGYKGRLALHEVMPITEEIERLAVERASALAIGQVAREQGMLTLRDDGMSKVLAGVTTLEEILRVVV